MPAGFRAEELRLALASDARQSLEGQVWAAEEAEGGSQGQRERRDHLQEAGGGGGLGDGIHDEVPTAPLRNEAPVQAVEGVRREPISRLIPVVESESVGAGRPEWFLRGG